MIKDCYKKNDTTYKGIVTSFRLDSNVLQSFSREVVNIRYDLSISLEDYEVLGDDV